MTEFMQHFIIFMTGAAFVFAAHSAIDFIFLSRKKNKSEDKAGVETKKTKKALESISPSDEFKRVVEERNSLKKELKSLKAKADWMNSEEVLCNQKFRYPVRVAEQRAKKWFDSFIKKSKLNPDGNYRVTMWYGYHDDVPNQNVSIDGRNYPFSITGDGDLESAFATIGYELNRLVTFTKYGQSDSRLLPFHIRIYAVDGFEPTKVGTVEVPTLIVSPFRDKAELDAFEEVDDLTLETLKELHGKKKAGKNVERSL